LYIADIIFIPIAQGYQLPYFIYVTMYGVIKIEIHKILDELSSIFIQSEVILIQNNFC